jgi:hypothetical protein
MLRAVASCLCGEQAQAIAGAARFGTELEKVVPYERIGATVRELGGTSVLAPAVTNAIYAATGKRVRKR